MAQRHHAGAVKPVHVVGVGFPARRDDGELVVAALTQEAIGVVAHFDVARLERLAAAVGGTLNVVVVRADVVPHFDSNAVLLLGVLGVVAHATAAIVPEHAHHLARSHLNLAIEAVHPAGVVAAKEVRPTRKRLATEYFDGIFLDQHNAGAKGPDLFVQFAGFLVEVRLQDHLVDDLVALGQIGIDGPVGLEARISGGQLLPRTRRRCNARTERRHHSAQRQSSDGVDNFLVRFIATACPIIGKPAVRTRAQMIGNILPMRLERLAHIIHRLASGYDFVALTIHLSPKECTLGKSHPAARKP